jgi:hypothetical protein
LELEEEEEEEDDGFTLAFCNFFYSPSFLYAYLTTRFKGIISRTKLSNAIVDTIFVKLFFFSKYLNILKSRL